MAKTEYEINRRNAQELSRLMLENPKMRVIAWIYSDGISDEYTWWVGDIEKPHLQTIAYSNVNEHYIEHDGNDFEDCYAFYGNVAKDWTDEELEAYAKEIPWETVIAVEVSAV